MSGFQIPGLGHAKPDEKLPPLSPDQTVGASSANAEIGVSQDVEIPDAAAAQPESQPETNGEDSQQTTQTTQTAATAETVPTEPAQEPNGDAMVVDQAPSPPSITGALEAALGLAPQPIVVDAEATLAQNNPTMIEAQPTHTVDTNGQAENPEWEADSSPYESSSSDTTSDDSSDADSDNEGYELLGVEETARMLMEAEGGSDDEGGDKGGKPSAASQLRTKNEMAAEPIPKPDVTITPDMKVDELGAVEHIVENMILIKAFTPGEYQVLDTGSVLCNEEKTVIGAVAETIGNVLQPMYIVHFDSPEDIAANKLAVGSKVLYPVDHAKFIFTEPLKNLKGSDASNIHDEEVGDDEMEFSDDEKEAEYKRAKKELKRKKAGGGDKGGKGPHPLRQEMGPSELNYDDVGDYTPLTRPAGFGNGPVSQEADPSPRGGFRGRGRGDSRGRGGRGRGSNRGGRGGASRDGYSAAPQSQQQAYPQQQQQVPPPPPNWNPQGQNAPPSFPNFGFQVPGWPQQPPAQGNAVPPPPPGWPGAAQGQQQQQQGGNNNAFMNPAVMAALMQHMQGQQGGQQQQQWQPPPPPGSGH